MIAAMYTTQLQAGLGMIDETGSLLNLWGEGMGVPELSKLALDNGVFPTMAARRVRNVVAECFAPRYLVNDGQPAVLLQQLKPKIQHNELRQIYFIYTCRANEILADFVTQVYWPFYAAGKSEIQKQDAVDFVVRSNQDGKTKKLWSESTIKRVSSYLVGCCGDFGLLEGGARKSTRRFDSFNIQRMAALFLCHELHFAELGDNAVAGHSNWRLFGLEKFDVVELMKSLSMDGHLLVQSAGGVVNIGWKYNNMQEVIDAIGR